MQLQELLNAYRESARSEREKGDYFERQVLKTDKDSGIINDANDYADETVGNPRYPLELFQRVIAVSLETIKIVDALPALDIT